MVRRRRLDERAAIQPHGSGPSASGMPVERIYAFVPYVVWIPAIFWGLHRARVVRAARPGLNRFRRREFGKLNSAGRASRFAPIPRAIFTAGTAFKKLRERPSVLVVFLNLAPDAGHSGKWTQPPRRWPKSPPGKKISPPKDRCWIPLWRATIPLTFRVQADHADYREVLKLERRARTKTSLLVRRWATIGILTTFVLGGLFLHGFLGSARPNPRCLLVLEHLRHAGLFARDPPLFAGLRLVPALAGNDGRAMLAAPSPATNCCGFTDDGVEVLRSRSPPFQMGAPSSASKSANAPSTSASPAWRKSIIIPLSAKPPGESAAFIEYLRFGDVVNVTQAFPVEMGGF